MAASRCEIGRPLSSHARLEAASRTIGKSMCLGIDVLKSEEEVFDI